MDRKTLLTFIAVYSFALATALFFGGDNEIKVDTVVDQPATSILEGDATDKVVAALRSTDGGHSVFVKSRRSSEFTGNRSPISL